MIFRDDVFGERPTGLGGPQRRTIVQSSTLAQAQCAGKLVLKKGRWKCLPQRPALEPRKLACTDLKHHDIQELQPWLKSFAASDAAGRCITDNPECEPAVVAWINAAGGKGAHARDFISAMRLQQQCDSSFMPVLPPGTPSPAKPFVKIPGVPFTFPGLILPPGVPPPPKVVAPQQVVPATATPANPPAAPPVLPGASPEVAAQNAASTAINAAQTAVAAVAAGDTTTAVQAAQTAADAAVVAQTAAASPAATEDAQAIAAQAADLARKAADEAAAAIKGGSAWATIGVLAAGVIGIGWLIKKFS